MVKQMVLITFIYILFFPQQWNEKNYDSNYIKVCD